MTIEIRKMSRDELKLVMEWAKNEGWNPGRHDYNTYYSVDPDGFLILTHNKEPIGAISIVRHSCEFAFIGLFIVLPESRGNGYGKQLWSHALKQLKTFKSVGLYSVPQQVSRYQKSGFFSEFTNHRWVMNESKKTDVYHLIAKDKSPDKMLQLMVKYDTSLWGSSRHEMFNTMLMQPESYAFVTFNQKTGAINGYGVIRPCIKGYRIGPIYCEDKESAKLLTEILTAQIPSGSKIIFDIPDKNTFSHLFAEYFNLTAASEVDTKAMFKGEPHDGREEICYGVASLEIG